MVNKWWLIGGGVFLFFLVIASIVMSILEEADQMSEGTAEWTVQRFISASLDNNFDLAYSFLSGDVQSNCSVEDFADNLRSDLSDREYRIVLDSVVPVGTSTLVKVTITEFESDGFLGSSEWSHSEKFTLHELGGTWLLTKYQWPYDGCGEVDVS